MIGSFVIARSTATAYPSRLAVSSGMLRPSVPCFSDTLAGGRGIAGDRPQRASYARVRASQRMGEPLKGPYAQTPDWRGARPRDLSVFRPFEIALPFPYRGGRRGG